MAQRQEQPRRSEETSSDTLGSRNSVDMKDWDCVDSDEVKVSVCACPYVVVQSIIQQKTGVGSAADVLHPL